MYCPALSWPVSGHAACIYDPGPLQELFVGQLHACESRCELERFDREVRAPYLLPVRTVISAAVACTFHSDVQSSAGVG